jgi:hypothetical protein
MLHGRVNDVNATRNLKIQQKQTVYFDKDALFDHKES